MRLAPLALLLSLSCACTSPSPPAAAEPTTSNAAYCSASAPALRELDEEYRDRGLVVVGMYHHKGDTPFDPHLYEATAKKYGFTSPVAVKGDPGYADLRAAIERALGEG